MCACIHTYLHTCMYKTTFESVAQCPTDLLEVLYSPSVLNAWLSLFVLEAGGAGMGITIHQVPSKHVGCIVYKVHRCSFMNRSEREKYFPKLLDRQLRMLYMFMWHWG